MNDFELCNAVAYGLRSLTVTDPASPTTGGNFDASSHKVSHSALMAAVVARQGSHQRVETTPEAQLQLGEATIAAGKGVCTHLAAAVAYRLIRLGMDPAKIEIVTTQRGQGYGHTFNAINRSGDITDLTTWGDACILVDIWWANQNLANDSLPVGDADANFGQGAFKLSSNPDFGGYLAQFGQKMGVVTAFG